MRYRLHFDRPIPDRATLEFDCQLPIDPILDASGREVEVPWITFPEAAEGPTRVELTPKLGIVFGDADPSWTRAAAAGPAGSGGGAAGRTYVEGPAGKGRPLRFRAMAMDAVRDARPAGAAPADPFQHRLRRHDRGIAPGTGSRRTAPRSRSRCPTGARIIAVRVGGRAAEQVDLEGTRDGTPLYRLRLPADAASRPVLIELQYQLDAAASGSRWQAPRLLDDGLVLQTLWEARLPWDRTLLGVPRGWSDENEWYWGGNLWIRRPARDGSAVDQWLLGDGCAGRGGRTTCARATSTNRSACSSADRPAVPANRRT